MVMVVGMEDRKKQDKLQAVWFAAGVAALMACLERAMLVSFVEQWRVIAFLALNLLLLAILFTSRSTPITPIVEETSPECISNTTKSKIEKRRVEECKKPLVVPSVDEVSEEETKDVKEDYTIIDNKENREDQLDDSIDETQQISMEELNERAEAFIAMFRQHLISDAKAYSYSKSCRIRTPIILKGGDKTFTKRRPIY
ncbi:uncharacterized protein LOC107828660 [Nicotiana tabacum]|uniref:Uncharacterized protein LOC107828660 n=1 Tax=Nicotiana tabacum TaxID=4097 RepID=A0A1S4DDM0_TOBAC|nr:uncharacterized protein LOC104098909 [Nicotiana tomentosiformis]XP_016511506.1 PREDICTED: uncharacterized protein LOC107828660 [Nicotiana tabacum]